MHIKCKILPVVLAVSISALPSPSSAGSWIVPGATMGSPAGAVPPPGLYFANATFYGLGTTQRGGTESVNGEAPFFIFVPGWNILGASYGMSIAFPFLEVASKTPRHAADMYLRGPFNTYVTPITLSWNLGNGFFLAVGESFYVPVNTDVINPPSGGVRSGTAFETSVNLSYIANGWILSANNFIGITTYGVDGYKTADYLNSDWTLAHTFGEWELGAIGYGAWELQTVPLAPGLPFRTSPAVQVGFGGLVGYNFGVMDVLLKATHQIVTKGTYPDSGKSDTRVWTTVVIPIWNSAPPMPASTHLAKY
jgi:hypothetical protein